MSFLPASPEPMLSDSERHPKLYDSSVLRISIVMKLIVFFVVTACTSRRSSWNRREVFTADSD
jgi:hypothetical protein